MELTCDLFGSVDHCYHSLFSVLRLSNTFHRLLSVFRFQLVALNPYAALCNRMLGEVIGKLQRGETDEPKS